MIERQDVPVIAGFYEVARILTQTPAFGANTWTDTAVMPGRCYNYRVAAYNNSGMSIWNINGPVQGCTAGAPSGPISLIATAVNAGQVDLTWSGATGQIDGYRVQRSTDGGLTWPVTFNVPNPFATGYSDLTVAPQTAYVYRVYAYNLAGSSPASNLAPVTTPSATPAAPSGLLATPSVLIFRWGNGQIAAKYSQGGVYPFSDVLILTSQAICRVGAQAYEEGIPISCGRFFLTYYFLFCIFNPSRSKCLSLS